MLDIEFIRQNPEKTEREVEKKGYNPKIVRQTIAVYEKKKARRLKLERLQAKYNELTKKGRKIIEKNSRVWRALKNLKEKIKAEKERVESTEKDFRERLYQLPNLPAEDTPVGKDESENVLARKWGKIPKFDFATKDHLQLGENLDLIDVARAAKISGTRFGYLKNDAVLLEFALIDFAFDFLVSKGFTPVIPPALTKVSVFHGLGYSEHGGGQDYYLVYDPKKEDLEEEANYYLIGTAEHSLVPMYMCEVLLERELPKRLVGFSSSFRKEAGSYGKDTRGIFRVHQFDKVEMVSFSKPQNSTGEHQYLLSLEEKLVQSLKLPYRVVRMCTGDLGFPAASKYDIECWIPSQEKYRETHSTSNCTDFQSRRLNIKYRKKDNKTEYVHILNGTAFAVGRMIIAILENYQTKDGSVKIPKVLQKYIGKQVIKPH